MCCQECSLFFYRNVNEAFHPLIASEPAPHSLLMGWKSHNAVSANHPSVKALPCNSESSIYQQHDVEAVCFIHCIIGQWNSFLLSLLELCHCGLSSKYFIWPLNLSASFMFLYFMLDLCLVFGETYKTPAILYTLCRTLWSLRRVSSL